MNGRQKHILSQLTGLEKTLYRHTLTSSVTRDDAELLKRSLRQRIRAIRGITTMNVYDELEEKLRQWGNSGNYGRSKLKELERALFVNKHIESTFEVGNLVSFEIECIFPNDAALDAFTKYARQEKMSKVVTVKDDGSLRTDDKNDDSNRICEHEDTVSCDADCYERTEQVAKEIIVTVTKDNYDVLIKVCNKLNSLDVTVNKSCGLHVHFDVRHMTSRQANAAGKRLSLAVPMLRKMLPKSRQNNEYCREDINGTSRRSRNSRSRYAFVNMQSISKHNTIEVRGHSGTTDANKMIQWTKLCLLIMETRNTVRFEDVTTMLLKIKAPNDLASYVLERIAKFGNTSKPTNGDDVSQDNQQVAA